MYTLSAYAPLSSSRISWVLLNPQRLPPRTFSSYAVRF